MTAATASKLINCQICGTETMVFDAKQKHCPHCGQLDGEVFKTAAQLRKALKLSMAVAACGGSAPDTINKTVRRLAEKAAGLPESSDATWAMVAVLLNPTTS